MNKNTASAFLIFLFAFLFLCIYRKPYGSKVLACTVPLSEFHGESQLYLPPDTTGQGIQNSTSPGIRQQTTTLQGIDSTNETMPQIPVSVPGPIPSKIQKKPNLLPKSGAKKNTGEKNKQAKPLNKGTPVISSSDLPEVFINSKKLSSLTTYLIWIDTAKEKTYIFHGTVHHWILIKTFICSTGRDLTPTIKGTFQSLSKAYFIYDRKFHCYLKYVTQIYNGYLMHSVILDKNGRVVDGTLGRKRSHGCVRLSLADSRWIYETIPLHTTIFIS